MVRQNFTRTIPFGILTRKFEICQWQGSLTYHFRTRKYLLIWLFAIYQRGEQQLLVNIKDVRMLMMMAAINVCCFVAHLPEMKRQTDSSEIKYAPSIEHIYYPPRKLLILK